MTRVRVMTAFLLLAACSALAQPRPRPSAPAPLGDADAGRRAYIDYACFYCHGTVGQGSLPAVGPRIARLPRSLDGFTAYVRRPTGRMSAYSEKVISDAALRDIYAYLRALPEPARSSTVPLLEQLRKR